MFRRKQQPAAEAFDATPRTERSGKGPLRNTPPVAADPAIRLFAELFGDPQANAARWFVCAVVAWVIVVILGLALYRLTPLKQTVPYLVEASEQGTVVRIARASDYRPTDAMVRAELGRWVERVMVIDPYLTRENLRQSTLLLRGKAVAQHRDLVVEDAAFSRLISTPSLVRSVDRVSVDVSQPGLAFIFVTTTERTGAGDPLVQKWRFTVHYVLSPPTTEAELMANPTGLNITHVERTRDNS